MKKSLSYRCDFIFSHHKTCLMSVIGDGYCILTSIPKESLACTLYSVISLAYVCSFFFWLVCFWFFVSYVCSYIRRNCSLYKYSHSNQTKLLSDYRYKRRLYAATIFVNGVCFIHIMYNFTGVYGGLELCFLCRFTLTRFI